MQNHFLWLAISLILLINFTIVMSRYEENNDNDVMFSLRDLFRTLKRRNDYLYSASTYLSLDVFF